MNKDLITCTWWERMALDLEKKSNSSLFLARHLTLDYYDCDSEILLDAKLLEKTLRESAIVSWATIISSSFNNFEPQGVSWIVVLAESHFTIHTWPEHGYVAIDMFACWDIQFEKWIELLTNVFKAKRVELVTDIKRWLATQLDKKDWDKKVILKEGRNNWEETYEKSNAWWIASSVDVFWCNTDLIRDADAIKTYVRELCDLIQMKTFWETNVIHFGEDEKVAWFSMTQLIETSLISGHFANATDAAYLDIFSCKYYNPSTMADFTVRFFKWKYYKLNVNIRDDR